MSEHDEFVPRDFTRIQKYLHSECTQDPKEALAAIEDSINDLNETVLAMKSYRNTIIPIHRLPNELLARIFLQVVAATLPSMRWMVVAQICHHWRAVALSSPRLWSTICSQNIGCIRVHLRRSRSVPLDISFDITRIRFDKKLMETVQQFAELVVPHIHRIRRLYIDSWGPEAMESLSSALNAPALCLTELSLSLRSSKSNTLAAQFFNGSAPLLQSLSLLAMLTPSDSPFYCGLLSLELQECSIKSDEFLRILQACPLLQCLTLRNTGLALSRDINTYPEPARIVELPRLVNLTIHNQNRGINIAYTLAHLCIPSHASLEIHCPLRSKEPFLSRVLPRGLTSPKDLLCMETLMLRSDWSDTVVIEASTIDTPRLFSLSLSYVYKRRDDQLLAGLCDIFSGAPVVTLEMKYSIPLDWQPSNWAYLFTHFPRLENVRIKGSFPWEAKEMRTILAPFGMRTTSLVGSSDQVLLCPRLKELIVKPFDNSSAQCAAIVCQVIQYRMLHGHHETSGWSKGASSAENEVVLHFAKGGRRTIMPYKIPPRYWHLYRQFTTNRAPLRAHLFSIGQTHDDICPACGSAPETIRHYLLQCPKYSRIRSRLYGELGYIPNALPAIFSRRGAINAIFRYIHASGRFTDILPYTLLAYQSPKTLQPLRPLPR
ncbi:hypothetical protein A0H81_02752 [Grifola frondosa]|uniref:F-box domain-containing protein n=1 Tax=Grifola frondosa TaxID=5627 RepID=A0A1C7MN45_GRIFR|nr:hypothetical protein A0H81_02752 [Grifola frondosa]